MSRDDLPTLTLCLACGGHYETEEVTSTGYRMSRCKWCDYGGMTREQVVAWHNHRISSQQGKKP